MKLTLRGHRIFSFDSSRRQKHDGAYIIVVPTYQNEKVIRGERFRSKTAF